MRRYTINWSQSWGPKVLGPPNFLMGACAPSLPATSHMPAGRAIVLPQTHYLLLGRKRGKGEGKGWNKEGGTEVMKDRKGV